MEEHVVTTGVPEAMLVDNGYLTNIRTALAGAVLARHLSSRRDHRRCDRRRRAGVHITAVGSDAEHKQELAVDLIIGVDRFVCDSRVQGERLGELRAVREADRSVEVVELGDIVAGTAPGRRHHDDVTICDLTGTGAQDTAIASLTVTRAAGRAAAT